MKKWMPLGALGLVVVALVLIFAWNPLSITGNARGYKATKPTLTAAAACPKGYTGDRVRNCETGTVLECKNEKPPYCCACVEAEPTLTCANVLCVAGTTCIEDCDGSPVCVPQVCEGVAGLECPEGFACDAESENPDEGGACQPDCDDGDGPTCETIRCAAGTTCVEDCDDKAACVPDVCGGIAGVTCPDGFDCELKADHPDAQGVCEADCEDAECGTCKSDDECDKGQRCTASEDCLADCDCPECTVCAGHCVDEDDE